MRSGVNAFGSCANRSSSLFGRDHLALTDRESDTLANFEIAKNGGVAVDQQISDTVEQSEHPAKSCACRRSIVQTDWRVMLGQGRQSIVRRSRRHRMRAVEDLGLDRLH